MHGSSDGRSGFAGDPTLSGRFLGGSQILLECIERCPKAVMLPEGAGYWKNLIFLLQLLSAGQPEGGVGMGCGRRTP